jgi:hypothetical protein
VPCFRHALPEAPTIISWHKQRRQASSSNNKNFACLVLNRYLQKVIKRYLPGLAQCLKFLNPQHQKPQRKFDGALNLPSHSTAIEIASVLKPQTPPPSYNVLNLLEAVNLEKGDLESEIEARFHTITAPAEALQKSSTHSNTLGELTPRSSCPSWPPS